MVSSRQKEPEGTRVKKGFQVYSSDNKRMGEVVDVEAGFFHVKKGLPFATDWYVPTSAVHRVGYGIVFLNVSSDKIEQMGWNEPPAGRSS